MAHRCGLVLVDELPLHTAQLAKPEAVALVGHLVYRRLHRLLQILARLRYIVGVGADVEIIHVSIAVVCIPVSLPATMSVFRASRVP